MKTSPETTGIVWSDAFLLGFAPMDGRHREFVHCVSQLRASRDDDVAGNMEAMFEHLKEHFEEERRWMLDTAFPSADCHIDEHDAVFRSAIQVREQVRQHLDVNEAHRFADALAAWFPGHADYLDSALSHWISKRTHGGAPVVIRRTTKLPVMR